MVGEKEKGRKKITGRSDAGIAEKKKKEKT
jgi:hypothetical protein